MVGISVDGIMFTGKTVVTRALVGDRSAYLLHAQPPPDGMALDLTSSKGVRQSFDYYLRENLHSGRLMTRMPGGHFVLDRLYSTEAYHLALDQHHCGGANAQYIAVEIAKVAERMPQVDIAVFLFVDMKTWDRRVEDEVSRTPARDGHKKYKEARPVEELMQENLRTIATQLKRGKKPVVILHENAPLTEVARRVSDAVKAVVDKRVPVRAR